MRLTADQGQPSALEEQALLPNFTTEPFDCSLHTDTFAQDSSRHGEHVRYTFFWESDPCSLLPAWLDVYTKDLRYSLRPASISVHCSADLHLAGAALVQFLKRTGQIVLYWGLLPHLPLHACKHCQPVNVASLSIQLACQTCKSANVVILSTLMRLNIASPIKIACLLTLQACQHCRPVQMYMPAACKPSKLVSLSTLQACQYRMSVSIARSLSTLHASRHGKPFGTSTA